MSSIRPRTDSIGSSFAHIRPTAFKKLIALSAFLWVLGLTAPKANAQAYTFPQQMNVGSTSAPVAVNVVMRQAGTVAAINVVGQGNQGVDFAGANSGTCSVGVAYPVGQTCTVGVSFAPLYPGVRNGAVVLTAANGTVLATEFLSGTGVGALGTFVPGMMSTLAGQATWLYNGDGELATNASIFLPFGIAVDSVGNVYIADQGNGRIRKVTASTGLISTIAGDGVLGSTGDGGPATQATLTNPSDVAIDGAGNIYISDTGNNLVRKITATTGTINTVAGTIGQVGYTGDGGLATSATLNSPDGIAIDSAGNLFIADSVNNAVRRVDAVTGIITTVAGTGAVGYSGDGGPATSAKLYTPWGVTPAPGGVLYIADQGNNRIRMISATGTITTVAGNGNGGFTGDTGPALQAALDAPAGVAIDPAGNMYIADSGNNRVRKITYGTNEINTIAGTDSQSLSGDAGPADQAGLYGPYTLALDGFGNLYIADVFHNRIREDAANTAALNFQPMRIGTVATPQPQTLENDGNAALNITSVQAVSNSVVDGPTTTCVSALTLPSLGNCTVGAAFAPVTLGTPAVGTISVSSNAINTPGTIDLSGNVLSENPSTVSLVASANPITAGDTVYFTVSVTSGGTTPTGQVTLLDGTTVIGTGALASGVATISVSTLAGGQHSITASYAGDSNNTSAVSSPLIEVVKFVTAPTLTTLSESATSVLAGTPVIFTATVSLSNPGSSTGTITGSVTFSDGSTIIGAGSVSSNGTATLTLSTLTVGQHSIVASYSGTTSFATSASSAVALTVQAATTGTTIASGSNPLSAGGTLVLTAKVTGNGVAPTGNVTFVNGSATLGTGVLSPAGVASLSVTGLAVGNYSIVAVYGGDANNNGSSSTTLLQTVVLATTTSVVTSSSNPAPQGGPVTLTAAVSGNGGIPTGNVQFLDGTTILGTGKLSPTGAATFTTSTLAIGIHNITASYQGDAADKVSTSTDLVQTIVAATTNISFTSSSNPAVFGSVILFNVTVQGTGNQPTGTVTLQDGPTTLGTQSLNGSGLATFSEPNMAIGTHNLVALYNGDTDHPSNSATLTQQVVQVTTSGLASSSPTAIAGTTVTLTTNVLGADHLPLTGTVTFRDGSSALATVGVNSSGVATYSSSTLSIGSHTITAVYSGDTLDQASTSVALVQTIQIATTATTLVSSANPAFTGATLTLTATVTGNGVAPTGSVVIHDGATTLGTLPLTASGVVILSTSTLTPGTHSLSAVYSGDTNDAVSTSATLSQSIVQQTSVATTSSANPSMFKDNVTITVTVTGGVPAYPPTGLVTLTDGATTVGSASVNALGQVQFTLTAPALGQHVLTATYAGDTHNSSTIAPALTQSVILRPTTNTFNSSLTALSAGQQVTFISLVQGVGPNFPTGTVTFVSGSTVLGTAPLNAQGLATLTFTPQIGSYSVVAQYPGDTLFAASNSAPTSIVVGPTVEFTMNVTPSTVSLVSGDHTTLSINIVTASTFNDTLAIGCAGMPPSATCTFNTNDIKVSGGSSSTLSVVLDTGNPLGAGATVSSVSQRSNGVLACILPGGVLLALLFGRTRRFRKQLSALAVLLMLCTVGMLSGCANSLNTTDTPAGTYTIQVVGSGVATGATQSGTILLTVTK